MNRTSITIFTPTYNRAYLLLKLYDSLLRQTYLPEEWIIVDDGSTDETRSIVQNFISEKKIPVIYDYQENGGKHRAINKGLKIAKGELFFIVDSDDYLTDNSLELINYYWQSIPEKEQSLFAGVAGLRIDPDKQIIGDSFSSGNQDFIDLTYWDLRYKFYVKGDKAEIYRTSVLREFPFPEFEKEKFLTEAAVWGKIALSGYLIRWFNEGIYCGEYLPGGLSSKYDRLLRSNPLGTAYFYNLEQLYKGDRKHALFRNYNYYYHSLLAKRNLFTVWKEDNNKCLAWLGMPLGIIKKMTYK